MAAVALPAAEVQHRIDALDGAVVVAAINGPRATVLSGDKSTLETLLASWKAERIAFRPLGVEYAFHSPQMEAFLPELIRLLEGVRPARPTIPIYSTVTGQLAVPGDFGASYWARNLREPVRFADAIHAMNLAGAATFLELSPHPVLTGSTISCVGDGGVALPSVRREQPERESLLRSLGALYTRGYAIDWEATHHGRARFVRLPSYPWQRERYWLDVPGLDGSGFAGLAIDPSVRAAENDARSPLLGREVRSPVTTSTVFETRLHTGSHPYLNDHRVQGELVVPASAFLEMAFASAHAVFGEGTHQLESVQFERALVLSQKPRTVQIVLDRNGASGTQGRNESGSPVGELAAFEIFSHAGDDGPWTLHVSGSLRTDPEGAQGESSHDTHLAQAEPTEGGSLGSIRSRCPQTLEPSELYGELAQMGLEYGPQFQALIEIARGETEVLADLRLPDGLDAERYHAHPVLLDAAFQAVAAASRLQSRRESYVPVELERMVVHETIPTTRIRAHVTLHPAENEVDSVHADIRLLGEDGDSLLADVHGVRLQKLPSGSTVESRHDNSLLEVQWEPQTLPNDPGSTSGGSKSWWILADRDGVGEALAESLRQQGESSRLVFAEPREGAEHFDLGDRDEVRTWLGNAFDPAGSPCRGVVYLWPLDASLPEEGVRSDAEPNASAFAPAHQLGVVGLLHLTQTLLGMGWRDAPRLWIVTREARSVVESDRCESIVQSPLWGLGRVIGLEHPEFRCTRVDLSTVPASQSAAELCDELIGDSREEQVAYRNGSRLVARLVRASLEDARGLQLPEKDRPKKDSTEIDPTRTIAPPPPPGTGSFALSASPYGVLDQLSLRETVRVSPGPSQVEIAVRAAGLNFRDVMKALGIYPSDKKTELWLGDECAGEVVAVGEGVEDVKVGDEVMALAPHSMGSFVTTERSLVVRKPKRISFETAATLPVAFLTAQHSLHALAHLQRGERILIHAATGGVGLAAVQLAQRAGAEIFATAGSPEKRAFLAGLGVPHVFDSRTLDFAPEILRVTHGRGVDVVLNSLAGGGLRQSVQLLAPSGRFVEIGKRDVYENRRLGLAHLKRNISFFVVDMDALFQDRPQLAASMLQTLAGDIQDGALEPLPVREFPMGDAASAFRTMAKAEQIGKIALDTRVDTATVPDAVADLAHLEGTILITGGFGALGLAVARSIVERGGRHIALLGRRAAGETARQTIDALRTDTQTKARESRESTSVQLETFVADVTRKSELQRALEQIERTMPPIRGVIHAAGLIDDAVVYQMTPETLLHVLAPKVEGAWHLHRLTEDKPLDAFVLFSSAASLLGSPGQGNYAAANAFLDALAHFRVARGLPALSINWGPWAEIGMAASQEQTLRGVEAVAPQKALQTLHRLATRRSGQIGAVSLHVRHWQQFFPQAAGSPFLSRLLEQEHTEQPTGSRWREELLALESPSDRRRVLEDRLRELFAQVLRVPVSAVDRGASLDALGADSLLALELKNHLEAGSGVPLPATLLFGGQTTVAEFASDLARRMGVPLETDAGPTVESTAQLQDSDESDLHSLLDHLESISDEDTRRLLADIQSSGEDDDQ